MEAAEVETLINEIMPPFFANFRTIVPGKVVSVVGNLATIQIAIQDLDSSGEAIQGVITLPSVPVMMVGGSINSITAQVAAGDLGLLLVCDRDVTAFKAAKEVSPVSSYGMANLQYSIFLPGLFLPGYEGIKINSSTSVLIQVGESTISVTPDSIQMTAGGASVEIAGGNINITGNLVINSAITFGSSGNVTGDLTIAGAVSATEDITAGGISLKSHVHGGVQTGSGTTGEPE